MKHTQAPAPPACPDRASPAPSSCPRNNPGLPGRRPKPGAGFAEGNYSGCLCDVQMGTTGSREPGEGPASSRCAPGPGDASRLRRGAKAAAGWKRYLFRSLLLFDPVPDHDVDGFPAEPLHYPLEAALLPCTHRRRGRREACEARSGAW